LPAVRSGSGRTASTNRSETAAASRCGSCSVMRSARRPLIHTATDFAATFRREAERLVAAFRAPDAMTKPMKLPFGELPGSVCVWIAAGDIFTHGWDLAKATGQPTDLEPDVAARLLVQIEPILPDAMRGPDGEAAFGPRVEIANSAPAADRLAAFEGRHP